MIGPTESTLTFYYNKLLSRKSFRTYLAQPLLEETRGLDAAGRRPGKEQTALWWLPVEWI